jgi:hypothetical protein
MKFQSVGIFYQLLRLSNWWYQNIEIKYLAKTRKLFVDSGNPEATTCGSLFDLVFRTRITPIKNTAEKHGTIISQKYLKRSVFATLEDYQKNVSKTMLLISLAKIFSPLFFLAPYAFIMKNYNRKYFPWSNDSEELFEITLIFSAVAFTAYTIFTVGCFIFIKRKYKIDLLDGAVDQTQKVPPFNCLLTVVEILGLCGWNIGCCNISSFTVGGSYFRLAVFIPLA